MSVVCLGALALAGPAAATGEVPDTCPDVLRGPPRGDLHKSTEPADGALVQPGDQIKVTLHWEPGQFDGAELHKALDCVTVDGVLREDLSLQVRLPGNNGVVEHIYTVPADLPPGSRLCDRGFVSGPAPDSAFERQKSNDVCFEVAAAPTPTPTPAPPEPAVAPEAPVRVPQAEPEPPAVAFLAEERPPAAQPAPAAVTLPKTGRGDRELLLAAGLALGVGGAATAVSARRRPGVSRS